MPPPPGRWPLGDPRPRRRHRIDGSLARAAVGRTAALDRARPRHRPAGARRAPGRGRRRGRGDLRDKAVRHHAATARRAGGRDADLRFGAAGHADRGRARPVGLGLCRRRLSEPAVPVGRRSRRADAGRSPGPPRWRRVQRPPAAGDGAWPAAGARCRGDRHRAVPAARSRGSRPIQSLAARRRSRRACGGVVHGLGPRRLRTASRAVRRSRSRSRGRGRGYTRRRLAQAAAGELEVTVDHADVLALPG